MHKAVAVYGVALLTFHLLFVGPGGYACILTNKFLSLMGLTVVLFAAFPFLGSWKFPAKEWFTLPHRSMLLFAAASIVSAVLSPFWKASILGSSRKEGLVTVLVYFAIFLLFSSYGFSLRLAAYLSGGSMTVFCLIALLQFDGRNPLALYPNGMNYYGSGTDYMWEYLGTIGNVDLAAAAMSLFIPLHLLYIFLQKEDPWRFFLLVPLALCSVVTIKMGVLAVFCALCGGAVLSIPVLLGKHKSAQKLSVFLILAALVCLLVFLRKFDLSGGFLHELHEILNGHISGEYGSQRIAIWRQVWEVIRERPLFGSGPDTLSLWGKGFTGYDRTMQAQITTVIDAAHNEYLNIWANQGILALAAYLTALAALAAEWVKNGVRDTQITICGCSILCYCIQAFFGMSSCMTAPYFWVLLGMLSHFVLTNVACPFNSVSLAKN